MATTYYLVGTGNINATSGVWATTSGGAAGTTAPVAGDSLVLDTNSGANTLTINAALSLVSFDCDGSGGSFAGTVVHNAFNLTITGSGAAAFRLSPLMTYTATFQSVVTLANTSGTLQLKSAGRTMGSVTQNGAGGTVQQQDNLKLAVAFGALTLTAGTWDCNNSGGYTITSPFVTIAAAMTFIAAGDITVGGGVSNNNIPWSMNAGATFTKNGMNLIVLGNASSSTYGIVCVLGGKTYNNLTLQNNGNPGWLDFNTNAGTLNNFTIGSGWGVAHLTAAQTVNCANLTVNGTQSAPCAIGQNSASTFSISCSGTVNANFCVFTNFVAAGAAVWAPQNSLGVGYIAGPITFPASTTPAQIATAVWQDLLASSDFSTAGSVGALLAALGNMQFTVPAMARGTVGSGSTATSVVTSAFDPPGAAANQFANGVVIFDKATPTAQLRGQRALISASSNAGAPTLTVGALTVAPASGDKFTVV